MPVIVALLVLPPACESVDEEQDDGIVHVSKVEIGLAPQVTMGLEETLLLNVTVYPENAADPTWTLINTHPDVVSVDEETLQIHPLKPGSSIVGAVSTDGRIRAVSIVTVDEGFVHVSDIEFNIPDPFSMIISQTVALEVTISPRRADNKKYVWEVSDPDVVWVDENDVLHAEGIGTATICAVTEDKEKRCWSTVTVMPSPMTSLALETHSVEGLQITSSPVTLGVQVLPDDGYERIIQWTSSDISVCLVDAHGRVTVTGGGTAVVTASSVDGSNLSDQCTVTVEGTAVKDRYYDAEGDNYNDNYYKKLYEPMTVEVPHFTGNLLPDGTKEVSGVDTQVWLDRNLGAAQRAVSAWDPLAAGSLFQFGRNADGHEKTAWTLTKGKLTPTTVNGTSQVLGASRSSAGHRQFIVSNDDWTEDQSVNGWGGPMVSVSDAKYSANFEVYSSHSALDHVNQVSNPCPYGYRIPTVTEFMQLTMAVGKTEGIVFGGENASELNLIETLYDKMYMVTAGFKPGKGTAHSSAGTENNLSSGGFFYWSNASNTGTTTTKAWQWKAYWNSSLSAFSAKVVSIVKADGCSIRCIKDTPPAE